LCIAAISENYFVPILQRDRPEPIAKTLI
jgi:hypothetical protein